MANTDRRTAVQLRKLRKAAGQPTLRDISARISGGMSIGTLSGVMTGNSNPSWPTVETVTVALGGDVEEMRVLWDQDQEEIQKSRSRPDPPSTAAVEALTAAINDLAAAIREGHTK